MKALRDQWGRREAAPLSFMDRLGSAPAPVPTFPGSTGQEVRMSSPLSRRFVLCAFLALALTLAVPALAAADALNVASATGSVAVNADGSRTVTVHGTWTWPTHRTNCNNDRAGVGIAIDWNDPNSPGNHVTTLNGSSIDVGSPTDNIVHPAMPGAF